MDSPNDLPRAEVLALLGSALGLRPDAVALVQRRARATIHRAGNLAIKTAHVPAVAAMLAREAAVLAALPAALPVPVPRVVLCDASLGVLVRPWVEGRPLRRLHLRAGGADVATALGRFLAALHRARPTLPSPTAFTCRWAAVPPLPSAGRRWRMGRRLRHALPRWHGVCADAMQEPAWPPVPLHGDMHADNIIVGAGGELAGIIDFAFARYGRPAEDFAYLWRLSPEFRDATLAAYRAAGGPAIPAREIERAELSGLLRHLDAPGRTPVGPGHPLRALAEWRLKLEQTGRLGPGAAGGPDGRMGPAQARPMAETVAIQTIE